MASYTTNLKSWGEVGQEFPNNYSYIEGEAPVDAWDNFLNYNLISDVKDHLIPLTNSRIESDYGASGGEPTSPEGSHLYHNTDDEKLNIWNTTTSKWDEILTSATKSVSVSTLEASNSTTQSKLVDPNETVQVSDGMSMTTSGVYQNDGDLVVNGSFTSSGPIIGDGSISGNGSVAVSGVIDGTVEPITATISNNIFVALSGWTTDNDGSSYEAYRFDRNGAVEIGKDEALTFEKQ